MQGMTTEKLNMLAMNFDPKPFMEALSVAGQTNAQPNPNAYQPTQQPSFANFIEPQGQQQPTLNPAIMQQLLQRGQGQIMPPAGVSAPQAWPSMPGYAMPGAGAPILPGAFLRR